MLRHGPMTSLSLLIALTLASFPGCASPYVNIPHEAGDVASENPNTENIRDLLAKSCNEVIRTNNLEGPIALDLPDETNKKTHRIVAGNVRGAISPGAETRPEPKATLRIVGVRTRGLNGEVDIRAPTRPGSSARPLHTVYADWALFSHWSVQEVRVWPGVREGDE